MALTRFRDLVRSLLPPWLLGDYGIRLLGTVGLYADACADATLAAARSAWLLDPLSPDDALPKIGSERRMPQYPSEANDNYRTRLHGAWDAYEWAGAEQAIIDQLIAFGFSPALAAVSALTDWTASGATSSRTTGPDDTMNAVVLAEDGTTGEHYVTTTASGVPTDKMVEVRFLARVDASRPWLRVQFGATDYLFVNTATRSIGATATPGGHGTVRGYRVGGWVIVRARFWNTSATSVTVKIGLASADTSYSYAGDGSSGNTIADVTVGTPEPIVLRDNEAGAPDRYNGTERWWSQFWVIVPEGTHSYSGSIPSADQVGVIELIKKWKPGRWSTQTATFITSGSVTDLMSGKTNDEWAALLTPADHAVLTVSI